MCSLIPQASVCMTIKGIVSLPTFSLLALTSTSSLSLQILYTVKLNIYSLYIWIYGRNISNTYFWDIKDSFANTIYNLKTFYVK